MASKINTASKALRSLLDGLTPELAYALGAADRYGNLKSAEARMLIDEGLAEKASYGPYLNNTPLGEILTKAMKDRVERMYPEPVEPEEEPTPEQPAAPTFTPDPEPVKPVAAVIELRPCMQCGAPKCELGVSKCSDCKIDVDPPR
jgi:hypothetical protein